MSTHRLPFDDWDEHTFELALERETAGLDTAAQTELDRLVPEDELEELERVMASIHLAELSVEEPPTEVMNRLHRTARDQVLIPVQPTRRESVGVIATWLMAAAAALMGILYLQKPGPDGPSAVAALELRDRLVAEAGDLLTIDWTPNEDLLPAGVSGRVDWSQERQEGYMTFQGLEPNDPSVEQFQLWVFDQTRHRWDEHPVDGGVFDVTDEGEFVVPIDARVPVDQAVLFAITVEEPGGVVVSQREKLILTAGV